MSRKGYSRRRGGQEQNVVLRTSVECFESPVIRAEDRVRAGADEASPASDHGGWVGGGGGTCSAEWTFLEL